MEANIDTVSCKCSSEFILGTTFINYLSDKIFKRSRRMILTDGTERTLEIRAKCK